jgi:hypothetical protein
MKEFDLLKILSDLVELGQWLVITKKWYSQTNIVLGILIEYLNGTDPVDAGQLLDEF